MELLRVVILLGILCYVGYHLYMFFYRPQEYAAMKQRAHDERMARLEAKRAEENKVAGNVAGGLAKAFLKAIFNHKRH